MPDFVKLEKAEIRELDDSGNQTSSRENWIKVQFNPETLKLSYSNSVVPPTNPPLPGDQRGNSAIQFVGKGTTKLSVQLWYDVTALQPGLDTAEGGNVVDDVQQLTQKVIYYITPLPDPSDPNKFKPPSVRFVWGSFQFDGIMESLEQSLEFFDPSGKPLRASIAINLTRQEITSAYRPTGRNNWFVGVFGTVTPGTKGLTSAHSGDSLQSLASSLGQHNNWQAIAEANGIENPRQLIPGQLIDMSARATYSQVSASTSDGVRLP